MAKNDDRLDGGGDEVQRFYLRTNPINGVSYMAPCTGEPSGGEFVKYEDHAALRQRLTLQFDELLAEQAKAEQAERERDEAVAAGRRVIAAFKAHGKSEGWAATRDTQRECEEAMLALAAALAHDAEPT